MSEPDASGVAHTVRRTKLLGGTSWLTRFTLRGAPGDYDGWASLGNTGWGFDEVLPYLVRIEADAEFGDQPWHGAEGPMPSTRYPDLEHTDVAAAAVQAMLAGGFPQVDDLNRPDAVGVGRMPMNSRAGRRVTSADAYLPVGQLPPNLTIRCGEHVATIDVKGSDVQGVRMADGRVIEAGWVVICAGAIGSPTILLRSGLGPAADLRALGLPVIADLPGVGANLADHPGAFVDCGYVGPARSAPVLHSVATFHSVRRGSRETPDLMLWVSDPQGDNDFGLDVVLLRPMSRGSVRLRSTEPSDQPEIQLPKLNEPTDVERLGEAYNRAIEIAQDPVLRRACSGDPPHTVRAAELTNLIRKEAWSVPHLVGTCAMGSRPEEGSVVNEFGQVYGVARLSVVDASIIPDARSGFTHFPTLMIAERLSERVASSMRR
jgi:choline dehydrogenase